MLDGTWKASPINRLHQLVSFFRLERGTGKDWSGLLRRRVVGFTPVVSSVDGESYIIRNDKRYILDVVLCDINKNRVGRYRAR